jgi:hypothetical protein
MKTLIEFIKEQNASGVVASVTKTLEKKVIAALKEERKAVAAKTYGNIEEADESLTKQHFIGLADHIKNSGVKFDDSHLDTIGKFLGAHNPRYQHDFWKGYVKGGNGAHPKRKSPRKIGEETELTEAMSKKHFVALADHIKNHEGTPFSDDHLKVLSSYLAKQNPQFKSDRWHGYVKGSNGPSGGKKK